MPNTYTEREVAQIIERAVMRQEEARRRQGAAGLSLDEIEKLGREVGIDPEFLRAAAAELDAGAGERESHTTATHNHVERWTTGPLDPHAWEDLTEDLRRRLGTDYGQMYGRTDSGKTVQTGATRTWEHTSGLGVHHRLVVSERGERTRIRLEQQVGSMSPPVEGGLYGLLAMLALGPLAGWTGSLLFSGALAVTAGIVLGVVLYAVASFAIYKADLAWRAKKMGQLQDLADDIATQLAAPVDARESARLDAEAEETRPPLLDLDALSETQADLPMTPRVRDRS
ncbi:MAG: hypothetical protein AAGI52_11735 [Bacteroidota bacterium]